MTNSLTKRVRRLEVIQGGKGRTIVVAINDGQQEDVIDILSDNGVIVAENDMLIAVRRFSHAEGQHSKTQLIRVA
ncbi:hypothetical protein C8J35_103522 [Rhizobium sp. PP-F2F-G38]|nr:hypothetical protein C8J35_103522 [Rhizobium sp. PP-F2F-G38]